MGRSKLICTGGCLMVTVQYSNDYKDDKNDGDLHFMLQAQVPQLIHRTSRSQNIQLLLRYAWEVQGDELVLLGLLDYSAAMMNMCSKCQKDMILLKQEHAKLTDASSKDVVCRISSSDESKLAFAGGAVASADLASQISQVKSKEGFKKCTAYRKRKGLTGFSCKCGDLFCAVHYYSEKHNCPFDYRNAGQNAIAKANPIIIAEKLNKI
ncbi:hypothetical protein CQW23_31986 [Capsicum baccatum]|uniref:AN1-type domain-containing protein n=1 Tax=Capsicum baccatum TaxID=33114 RepID=A0A2G2V607_CAPBA|nr:hypothetical protein CQW23_31986 [Capsicum baccatum]